MLCLGLPGLGGLDGHEMSTLIESHSTMVVVFHLYCNNPLIFVSIVFLVIFQIVMLVRWDVAVGSVLGLPGFKIRAEWVFPI